MFTSFTCELSGSCQLDIKSIFEFPGISLFSINMEITIPSSELLEGNEISVKILINRMESLKICHSDEDPASVSTNRGEVESILDNQSDLFIEESLSLAAYEDVKELSSGIIGANYPLPADDDDLHNNTDIEPASESHLDDENAADESPDLSDFEYHELPESDDEHEPEDHNHDANNNNTSSSLSSKQKYLKNLLALHSAAVDRFPTSQSQHQSFIDELLRKQEKRQEEVDKLMNSDQSSTWLRCQHQQSDPNFISFKCLAYLSDEKSLRDHMKIHQSKDQKANKVCAFCGSRHKKTHKLRWHLETHHGEFTMADNDRLHLHYRNKRLDGWISEMRVRKHR